MLIEKETLTKSFAVDVETEDVLETFDLRIKIEMGSKNTVEDVMNEMHRIVNKRMAQLFACEVDVAPRRLAEAEHWRQMDLFGVNIDGEVTGWRENLDDHPDDDNP